MALPDSLQALEMQTAESGDARRPASVVSDAHTPAGELFLKRPFLWLGIFGVTLWLLLRK